MLELHSISKTYTEGGELTALNNLSLKINQGEFVAIVGPSGCGKSTLLHILGLLDKPDSGEYLINDQRVDRLSSKERARMRNQTFGFVFQSFNLLPRTSIFENVMLPLRYRPNHSSINRNLLVNEAVTKVGLKERISSLPNQLSGGQQQRVAIARALVGDPQVILADEPTGNLDTKNGLEIMEIFESIHQKGKTVVMVTHNNELLKHATRIITMQDGQIVEDKLQK
jgi:putative ABC transport system ATP-binding protein